MPSTLELSVMILKGPRLVSPLSDFKASESLSYHMTEKPVLMACNIPVKRALYMILYFLIHFNLQVGI